MGAEVSQHNNVEGDGLARSEEGGHLVGEVRSGADDEQQRTLSRRHFLSLAAAGVAAGGAAGMLGPVLWDQLNRAGAATRSSGSLGSTTGRTLVLVTLYGGNDGLNTVVPYKDPSYASARGILAVDPSTVLDLGDGFGLHPAMPRFHKLWADRHLAIVQGVGFANPNYSHFESMDIWQTAQPQDPSGTGWLGSLDGQDRSRPVAGGRHRAHRADAARRGQGAGRGHRPRPYPATGLGRRRRASTVPWRRLPAASRPSWPRQRTRMQTSSRSTPCSGRS